MTDEERENLIKKLGYCEQEYEQDILNQEDIEHYDNKHEVIKYFEERCK